MAGCHQSILGLDTVAGDGRGPICRADCRTDQNLASWLSWFKRQSGRMGRKAGWEARDPRRSEAVGEGNMTGDCSGVGYGVAREVGLADCYVYNEQYCRQR